MSKISVIIPVYNAENELETAIKSIINQSIGFDNIEMILVDDKSTDNSKEIIKKYEHKYNNIVGVYLDENSGLPGKPRSIGIEYANSDYLMFLDADDEYTKEAFEIMYTIIENEQSDFVIANYYFNFDGEIVKSNFKFTPKEGEGKIMNLNPLKNQENFNKLSYDHIGPWGKIFKKDLIIDNNIRFPEDTLCEDTFFYFKSLINSKKVTILPKTYIYKYNTFENKKTAIHIHDLKKFNNFLNGIIKLNELLKDLNLSAEVTISNNIANLLLIFTNLNNADKKNSIKKIYELEKKINTDIKIDKKEIEILNNLILNKHFTAAILISNIYNQLYSNKTVKNIYRKINNNRFK